MDQPAHLVMTSAGKARLSAAELLHMAAVGAFDDMKGEPVDGAIKRMNPPMSGHAGAQALLTIRSAEVCGRDRVFGEVRIV